MWAWTPMICSVSKGNPTLTVYQSMCKWYNKPKKSVLSTPFRKSMKVSKFHQGIMRIRFLQYVCDTLWHHSAKLVIFWEITIIYEPKTQIQTQMFWIKPFPFINFSILHILWLRWLKTFLDFVIYNKFHNVEIFESP